MSDSRSSGGGGIGFVGLLQLLFIALKLLGQIDWSWWWVLAPTWVPAVIVLLAVLFYVVVHLWAGRQ